MDRRRFLKQVMLYCAGLSVSIPVIRIPASIASSPAVPDVAQTTGTDYGTLVQETINLLGGMSQFVKPGNKVVVKPNIGWDPYPRAGCQHPSTGC